ncbi:MAG: hypothetical protein ABIR29_02940 [Chthoniobacterales bacterium]
MKFPAFHYLLVLLTGLIDWLSDFEVSMSLFYGIPIMFAIWFGDRKSGFLVAIFCGITWWWADILAGHLYSHILVTIWEPASRFAHFWRGRDGRCGLQGKSGRDPRADRTRPA